jgi:hypothetical protein
MVLFVLGYSDSSRVKTSHVQVSQYFIFFHINSSDFSSSKSPLLSRLLQSFSATSLLIGYHLLYRSSFKLAIFPSSPIDISTSCLHLFLPLGLVRVPTSLWEVFLQRTLLISWRLRLSLGFGHALQFSLPVWLQTKAPSLSMYSMLGQKWNV